MSRRIARLIPFYDFGRDEFFGSDGAPPEVAKQRQDAFFRLAQDFRERFAKGRQMTAEASKGISDLQFTQSYRVPFQYSRLVRENLGAGTFVQSSAGVTITDLDGNVFYDLTGSYGVNILGNDFYKECIASAEARGRALGPVLGSYHPVVADNVARLKTISRARRGLVPHVGNRGRDAGGAARALSHRPHAPGAVRRRLSRLVGRRAARRRQSARAARDLYAGRDVRADAARAADAPRHRLRAGQSAAGASSQRECAGRFRAGRFVARRRIRPGGLCRLAQAAAPGLHRARHRADLRRGVRRLPPRTRRRPGIFRRPCRHGHLRQESRPAVCRSARSAAARS